ncbi:hypothetical protein Tco_0668184 [Tanacetum coccineum]
MFFRRRVMKMKKCTFVLEDVHTCSSKTWNACTSVLKKRAYMFFEGVPRKEYGGGGGSPQLTWLRHHTTTARHSPKQTNSPFGPDPRECPAGKQRAPKKQKSVETTSVEGSTEGSTGGSQSESISSLVSQDYRRKCDAAEKAYEAKREKELAIMQCKELEFLMIDPSSLPPAKRAIIERKQAEIMRKYPDA